MKIKVTKNFVSIDYEDNEFINKGEYKIHKCYFNFSEEYDELTKKAIFETSMIKKEMPIINNECDIPYEVLNSERINLRVYAYSMENDELILRYSPRYSEFYTLDGSYIDGAEPSEEITPTQFEKYTDAMNKGLIKADESLKVLDETNKKTIENGEYAKEQGDYSKEQGSYAKEQGDSAKEIADDIKNKLDNGEFNGRDGVDGIDGKNATINGLNSLNIVGGTNIDIEQNDDTLKINNTYAYDDSEIKEEISVSMSDISKNEADIKDINDNLINYSLITETGSKIELNINSSNFKMKAILKDKNGDVIDTSNEIDLPLETMVIGASYDSDKKELIISLQNGTETHIPISSLIDGLVNEETLNNYIKKTDYPTTEKAGVIKKGYFFETDSMGTAMCKATTYNDYLIRGDNMFIAKGTLENVLKAKIGSIDTVLDTINGEVI